MQEIARDRANGLKNVTLFAKLSLFHCFRKLIFCGVPILRHMCLCACVRTFVHACSLSTAPTQKFSFSDYEFSLKEEI